jgi:hypothetical protein
MPRADATRITWFLGLQRILRFPRFFLAPSIFSRSRRGPAADLSDAAPSEGSVFQHRPAALPLKRHPRQDPFAERRRSTPPIVGMNGPVSPRLMTKIMTERLPNKAPRQLPLGIRVIPGSNLSFERLNRVNPAAGGVMLGGGQRNLPMMNLVHASSGSSKSTALAPLLDPAPVPRSPERRGDHAPRRTIAGGSNDLFRSSSSVLAAQPFHSKQRFAGDQMSFSPDRDGTAATEPQRGKSTVSTIHIDGSALGRWAVQHLERALNKPATGMTGIDPRAAVPRSRVAPF